MGPISLSLEEVAVQAANKVLMEADLYLIHGWGSTRNFRRAALASPNQLIRYYVLCVNFITL